MSDIDARIRDAYRSARMPEGLKAATLSRIEDGRSCAGRSVFDGSDDAVFSSLYGMRAKRGRPRLMRRMALAAAACAVVVAVGVGGFAFAMAPVAHVGIDVNPSFELSVNRFDRIVDARAVNDDAAEVLAQIDVKGMPYAEAMDELAQACNVYIGEDAVVEVGVACGDAERCEAIESAALRSFDRGSTEVHCGRLSDEQRRSAADAGMGLGRYRVYDALVQAGVDLSREEAMNMSMAQLRALAAQEGVDTCDSACAGHAMGQGASCGEGHGRGCGRQAQGEVAGQGEDKDAVQGGSQGQSQGQRWGQGEGDGQGQGWGHQSA